MSPLIATALATPRPDTALPSLAADLAMARQGRADFHALLAALLLRQPEARLLRALAGAPALPSSDTAPLPLAWRGLRLAAAATSPALLEAEQAALFGMPGQATVAVCASRYVAGGSPLVRLRHDLRTLGLARRSNVDQTEDHLGALCETMRFLIAGALGLAPQPRQIQRCFFDRYIAPWYSCALHDLRRAEAASFYVAVADFAEAFLDFEADAFALADSLDDDSLRGLAAVEP